jgi:hypothetical protein
MKVNEQRFDLDKSRLNRDDCLKIAAEASFTVNSSAAVRFEIRKVSGRTNRTNLDSIVATAYAAATPTPTLTATLTVTPTLPSSSSVHLTMGQSEQCGHRC